MFWYTWPSWITELVAGVGVIAALVCPLGPWLAFGIAMSVSLIYEKLLDMNGWSWVDVGQRTVGMLVGLGLALLWQATR